MRPAGSTENDSRNQWIITVVIVTSTLVPTWLLLRGGYPGWMTTDSRNMLYMATGRVPYSDWYAPALSWFWSHLGAATTGPLVPHRLQVLTYSAGVLFASLAVGRRHRVLAVSLPWLMLVNPAMWTLHYIWRDSFMVAVLVLTLGLGFWLRGHRLAGWAFLPVGALSGLAVVSRPYLMPLAMALVWLLCWSPARGPRSWLRPALGMGLAATVTLAVAIWLPKQVIPEIQPTRAGEAVLAFDALTLDCEHAWAGQERPRPAVSPPGLWLEPKTICEDASFGQVGRIWAAKKDQSTTVLDVRTWWTFARPHLGTVVGSRLQHAVKLMVEDPGRIRDVDEGVVLTTPGIMGSGLKWGFPSGGGVEFVVLAALSAFLPKATGLWILAPAVLALIGWAFGSLDRSQLLLGMWSPVGAVVSGLLAPANDYRYVAPFAITGWLTTLLLLSCFKSSGISSGVAQRNGTAVDQRGHAVPQPALPGPPTGRAHRAHRRAAHRRAIRARGREPAARPASLPSRFRRAPGTGSGRAGSIVASAGLGDPGKAGGNP